MTSTTSPSAVIDVMQRDIERASSEDEKNAEFKQGSGDVAQLYASGTPKSEPSLMVYDAATEKRLVRKVDLMIVPTVAMLYLMCTSSPILPFRVSTTPFRADLLS